MLYSKAVRPDGLGNVSALFLAVMLLFLSLQARAQANAPSQLAMNLLDRQTLSIPNPPENSATRYENGYFAQVHRNLQGGIQGNVFIWDKNGSLTWNPRVSVTPGDQIALSSVSITTAKLVTISGYSVNRLSGATYFIATQTVGTSSPFQVIRLGRFLPTQACSTIDGTLWVIGSIHEPKGNFTGSAAYGTLRHFDSRGVLLGSYIPRNTLASGFETAFRSESQTFLRCSGPKVALVSGENNIVITATTSLPQPAVRALQLPFRGGEALSGCALFPTGSLFVSYRTTAAGTAGPRFLLALLLSAASPKTLVGTAVGGGPDSSTWPLQSSIARLAGNDATSIVYFEHGPGRSRTVRATWASLSPTAANGGAF